MVKRQSVDPEKEVTLYTTPEKPEPEKPLEAKKPKDPAQSFGVGLKESEWARFDKIATELGQTKHAVALWALRDFLRRWDAGEIKTQTKRSLLE
jgi:hypothetical protein